METIKIDTPVKYMCGMNGIDMVCYKTICIMKRDIKKINEIKQKWNEIINKMENIGFNNYEIVKYKGGNGYYRWYNE